MLQLFELMALKPGQSAEIGHDDTPDDYSKANHPHEHDITSTSTTPGIVMLRQEDLEVGPSNGIFEVSGNAGLIMAAKLFR
jgi:hypothetical protein